MPKFAVFTIIADREIERESPSFVCLYVLQTKMRNFFEKNKCRAERVRSELSFFEIKKKRKERKLE